MQKDEAEELAAEASGPPAYFASFVRAGDGEWAASEEGAEPEPTSHRAASGGPPAELLTRAARGTPELRAPRIPSLPSKGLSTAPPPSTMSVPCPAEGEVGDTILEREPASRRRGASYVGELIDGRYRVDAVIGEGGMGTVYLGRRTLIEKQVAIKVLHPSLARRTDVLERFLAEASAASAIASSHIADVLDFGSSLTGPTYIVMEYLDGALLEALIQSRVLSLPRALTIAEQLTVGLGAAHAAGIVHRDLKPGNVIVVQRDGRDFAKILDFGVAKFDTLAGRTTSTGSVMGTPHYMAPEQALGAEVDRRADIYSLGVILYRMLTGRLPFEGTDPTQVMAHHVSTIPVAPRKRAPAHTAVPAGLESLILRCLEKDPKDRYSTMRELRHALRSVRHALASGSLLAPPAEDDGGEAERTLIDPPSEG